MFSLTFQKDKLNLSDDEWRYVQELIHKPRSILVYEEGQMDAAKMMALGACLAADRTAILRLHVKHSCQYDPTELLPWEGLYPTGSLCPSCSEEYTTKNTKYDLEIIIKYPLELT